MRQILTIAAVLLLFPDATPRALAATVPVSEDEQAQWFRRLIPLPKEIAIDRKVELPASQVRLRLRQGAGDVERTAADELRALLKQKAESGGRFEILIGVSDARGKLEDVTVPEAARLAKLPNAEQAYVIRPQGDSRLVLTALDERGVFYAAQTLRQLLEGKSDEGTITIPLVTVTDWPDLAERGEWGGSSKKDVVWMARHKMNLVEGHVSLGMTKDGRGEAKADEKLLEQAQRHALKFVPVITHLNGLGRSGIYQNYPGLRGKGDKAQHPTHKRLVVPCCSQPKLIEVLADWMCTLASQKGVTDICAWLSELRNQFCSCEKCREAGVGQYAIEARCLVRAWRMARKQYPTLGLRILLTQGSYATNDKVLAEIPEEVGVSYYDGGRTYDSSRDPMIYPLLENYAAKGRWLGCYPQLTASWRIVCPWSGPQFIKYRMTEFVEKKLKSLCGYATPHNRLYDFNITATAEWSWNSQGRGEREFAAAWATRRGIKDPDAAAEWAVTLGPVGWDVYGSRVPFSHFFGRAAGMVKSRAKPVLGKGMFRYFPTVEHIDRDLAACEKAMTIATRLDSPTILLETQVIQGYVQIIREIYTIAKRVSTTKRPTYTERVELQDAMTRLSAAGLRVAEALKEWERVCTVESGGDRRIGGSRLMDTIDVTEKTVVGIGDALAGFGIRNPIRPYMRNEVGGWATHDFDEKVRITKTFDVSEHVKIAGTYSVGLQYTTGWWGCAIYRVALASAPKDKPDRLTELSVDKHEGSTGARSKGNVYSVSLKRHDPNTRYFIVADIRGISSVGKPPNRQGCNGIVWMKAIGPKDWQTVLDAVRPLSDDELRQRSGAKFSGKGLRVAVAQGGYGSKAVLSHLRKTKGIDAQPLLGFYKDVVERCQVIVLPQPRSSTPMGKEVVRVLESFVRTGGGLITTHNAVGYRGHPLILTDICAKGLEHMRDKRWVVAAKHPVTAGIDMSKPLPHSYFDHIELERGPKGLVLARAAKSRRPVVVCGEFGKGRYVACGMAIGLATDSKETPPVGAEARLLGNAVRWCGRLP